MITSTLGRGGSEQQMIATASGLVARGYDVQILALGLAAPGVPTIEQDIEKLGITPKFRSDFVFGSEQQLHNPALAAMLMELPLWFSDRAGPAAMAIRYHRPAVVHCWLEFPGVIAAFASCALGVPRVVLGQRTAYGIMQAESYSAEHIEVLRSGYPLVAGNRNVVIINNSRAGAQSYERWLNLPADTIRVLYNGFDPQTVRNPSTDEVSKFRGDLGITGNVPIVGGLMRFVRQKDPELWLDVAAEVAAARPDVRFLLAGYGELESTIARRITALNLCDRVILPGSVSDAGLFYAAVDVVLLTSIVEGTPNVLLEAQAAGRPVVAPDTGGIAEAIADGPGNRLVTPRSARSLAAAVLSVLNDAACRKAALTDGPRFVADRFGLDRMVRETIELYRP